jgi:type IV pilus assembly protein PilY1
MTSNIKTHIQAKLFQLAGTLLLAFSVTAVNAAIVTDLGNVPLVSSATANSVLPNLMYVLDNSGSMQSDYMPDYVNDSNKCKTTATSGDFSNTCNYGDPPYNSSVFNSIYYNPEIRYTPGVSSTGAPKTNMDSANTAGWTSVPIDGIGTPSAGNTNLIPNAAITTGYPDIVWCNKTSTPTTAELSDPTVCKLNGPQYIFPNNTGTQATSYNQRFSTKVYPFYYTVSAGEYCTNKDLTSCVTASAPTGVNTFPAKLRWCNSAARTDCRAKYQEGTGTANYTFAKWTGITTSSVGKIKFNADTLGCGVAGTPSCVSPSALSVTNLTINGIRIIPTTPSPALTITDTTSASSRNQLARNVRDAINTFVPSNSDPDFTASVIGDVLTISPLVGGPFTGTIALTTTTANVAAVVGSAPSNGTIKISAVGKNKTVSIKCGSTFIGQNAAFTSLNNNTASTRLDDLFSRINTTTNGYTISCTKTGAPTTLLTCSVAAPVGASACSGGFSVAADITTTQNTGPSGGTSSVSAKTYTIPTTISQFTGGTPVVTTFNRVDIEPGSTFAKAAGRTDCATPDAAATTCTYAEEMTNFANWYSYYRTRMTMMKTSTSLAFKDIGTAYRVGFVTINSMSSNYLPVGKFDSTQKASWYSKLFAAGGNSSTPLRSALSTVGRIYAGKENLGFAGSDPVQYSCQQNFTILTTDGYWNSDSDADVKNILGGQVGNADARPSPAPVPSGAIYEGPAPTYNLSNSLADVAKYYYDEDLRTGAAGSAACTGGTKPNGTTGDVCDNNVFVTPTDNNNKQHMTTFTLGLGVDATLTYTSDYKTATSGDFYELKQGNKFWPKPVANTQSAVDDLWHAAVNGQGTYFSAKDPNQLASSLSDALNSISAKVGSGAAAATSTLNPVAGDNFAYVASYTSQKWVGNLESREINIDTGKVSEDASWCVETVLVDSCATEPVSQDVGGATVAYCVTPGATAASCPAPGILSGSDCKVEIASACPGTMTGQTPKRVTATADTRTIYMNVGSTLGDFTAANLTLAGKDTNFTNSFLAANLSQYGALTVPQRAALNISSLVDFLRGRTGFEDRTSNVVGPIDNRLYRFRENTLGDLVDATPVFIGPPKANYSDPGYGTATTLGSFKATQATRQGNVYIGANDGMLHAIDAVTGQERWAFVPTMVLNNMWKLADKNYGKLGVDHSYYVNGDILVNDICASNCATASATWKTVLVAGLGGGGKGYFALDITDPNDPHLLWEFDTSDDSDIGYSYGNPIITKKTDGTWVVLITSGYNNLTGTNKGKGFLYVLNANTGVPLTSSSSGDGKYATGQGDDGTGGSSVGPSGLAEINIFVSDGTVNNTAEGVYGGDLLGNFWQFDINKPGSASNPFRIAILKDPAGKTQPITVKPELAKIGGKKVFYVGTGRYLGTSDLELITPPAQQQTIYAISEDTSGSPATLDNPRSSSLMVSQTLENDAATATRSIHQPANEPNFASGRGWYIDFPDLGERQNVAAQLVFGTLLLPTTVPTSTECSPGGYGWLNFLDYKTGKAVSGNVVASKTNAPIVGINVLYVKGKPVVNIVTANDPTPKFPPVQPDFSGATASGFTNHRVIWRELIDEQ